MLGSDTKIGG